MAWRLPSTPDDFGTAQEQTAMATFLAGLHAAYIMTQCYIADGGNVMS